MQGVNKVRALGLRADGSDVIFPKSPCCCNKDPLPKPPSTKGSTTTPPPPRNSVVRSEPAQGGRSLADACAGIFNKAPYSGL